MDLKKENNTLQKQTTYLKIKSLYTLILLILNIFLISTNGKCQENDNISVSELNGIWRNSKYTSNYYLFHNGKYLFFIEGDPTLSYGIYGFYPNSVDVENLKNISLNKTQLDQYKLGFASNNGGVIGYEFEIGERLLNLYNQNDFFYEKLYVLPQKIVAQVRAIAKEKKLNIDNFIYSEETIGVAKATIYTAPNVKSKMYLVKGDAVKITEENGKWVKIQYKGKKLIEGWLRKQDL